MPIFELLCDACAEMSDTYVPTGAEDLPPCAKCQGKRRKAGLAAFSIRTPHPTGVKTEDGRFVRGTWGPPPRRVKRRIKTFA